MKPIVDLLHNSCKGSPRVMQGEITQLSKGTNFEIELVAKFDKTKFPGYSHSMTNSPNSTRSSDKAYTIKFRKTCSICK